ncbi:response regulator transcription factor [Catellatospora citrea]|uniref:DNA-binding response regulator n=1 Tax=Catellatospora citrea TaxID=53366 RepID=A0A8J3P2E1_9ACTN|nr:response regulator transcription factor [Catellatospora citrea]RKE10695.1 DNA-binding response OmpR family regulator [Catellatospora citrea]GIG01172.1 DNA-binding response regulator [Catellatospora citrea]
MRPTALVVDDEPQMTAIIAFALETQNFDTLTAHDGATALNLLRNRSVDLVVLDVMMPTLDGLSLCARIRRHSTIPIMLLSALSQHDDIITGLEHGADDYVTKPFHPREVALRAQALVRRREGANMLRVGELVIDCGTRTVSFAGRRVEMPYTEFQLLLHLAGRPGVPQSWRTLLRDVWGTEELIGGRDVVKSAVYRLRSRLSAVGDGAQYICNLRGVGYLVPDLPPAATGTQPHHPPR